MGYLGLVPSEHSSGNSIHRGSITKTGNAHARRLLTEAAWNYRFPARLSRNLRERSHSVPEAVCNQPTDISLIHRRSSRLVPHHPRPLAECLQE